MHEQAVQVLAGAARGGSIEACMALLAADRFAREINKICASGTTPLHIAAWRNNLALVEALLAAGATTEVTDKESGWTALHRALYFGNLRIAAALLMADASLTAVDWRDRSPVDLVSNDLKSYLPSEGPGDVYAWGAGTNYALGTGSTEPQVAPTRVDSLRGKKIVSVAAAKFHSAAVTEDGQLYTWGFGRGGRLGHPDSHLYSGETAVIAPRCVAGLGRRSVVMVAAAKHHTLLCTSAGEVWTMGSNRHGQLGLSAVDTQVEPRRVAALRARIVWVAAANKHSVVASAGGEVFSWGSNDLGQLGYGTFDSASSSTPREVEALKGRAVMMVATAKRHTLVLTVDGDVYTWGHRGVSPRRVNLAGVREAITADGRPVRFHRGHSDVVRPTVVAICAGAAHSSALTGTGVVLTWRSADPSLQAQEVGASLAGKQVVSISAGKYRTAVVTDDGDVYAWEGRSDFFPAEGRRSGSGSKKKGMDASGNGGGRSGTPGKPGLWIPMQHCGPQSQSPRTRLPGESWGADGVGSWGGSSDRQRSGSFFERSGETQKLEGTSPGDTISSPGGRIRSRLDKMTSGVDTFEPIIPQRVPGLKRAALVAVGEKHSLALQRWSVTQLDVLPTIPWLGSSFDVNIGGSDGGESEDERQCDEIDNEQSASSLLYCNTGEIINQAATVQKLGPLTLQQLCEGAVARSLVDPRTALQVLEYADLAGAATLKAFCLAAAVCNLDAVLLEARGAFEELSPHLMAELERVYKSKKHISSGHDAEHVPGVGRWLLCDASRPTAAPQVLGDVWEGVEGVNGLKRGLHCEESSLSQLRPRPSFNARGESSFKDLNVLAAEQAATRLCRGLHKKLQQIEHLENKARDGVILDAQQSVKVAQRPVIISALGALDGGMPPEEVQVMLQVAAAAHDDVTTRKTLTGRFDSKDGDPSKVGSGNSGRSKRNRRKSTPSASSVLGPEASTSTVDGLSPPVKVAIPVAPLGSSFTGAASPPATLQVSVFSPDNAGAPTTPAPAHVVHGFATAAPASSSGFSTHGDNAPTRTGRTLGVSMGASRSSSTSSEKPRRKGALSMFLRGELDEKKQEAGQQSSLPAWGAATNVLITPKSSLKMILDEEAQHSTPSHDVAGPPSRGRSSQPAAGVSSRSGPAQRMALADFLNPSTTAGAQAVAKSPAWGGVVGASPPGMKKLSLREIQEEQEKRRLAHVRGASPPPTSRPPLPGLSTRCAGTTPTPDRCSSPGIAHILLGSSPGSGANRFFATAPLPHNKWYVPEDDERRMKSLKDIQNEERAMKELAKRYGDGNVRFAK